MTTDQIAARAYADFLKWCDTEGITLTHMQYAATWKILHGIAALGFGKGAGKTFTLETIERYLDEHAPRLHEVQHRFSDTYYAMRHYEKQ